MSNIYTVDASVFVSAYNDHELGHPQSHELLTHLNEQGVPVVEPTILLPEVTAAIARVYGDEELATDFASNLNDLPNVSFINVDTLVANLAVQIAARHRLRGSDAVYAAVAQRYNTTLVTLDAEQQQRAASVVTTRSPAQALEELDVQDEE